MWALFEVASMKQDMSRAPLLFGTVVALVGSLYVLLFAAWPPVPAVPDLKGISLELPSAKGSPQLAAMLDNQRFPGGAIRGGGAMPAVYRRLAARVGFVLSQSRWPKDPQQTLAELRKLDPSLEAFRKALYSPGCLPRPIFSPKRVMSISFLLFAGRLEIVESVALVQTGKLQLGVSKLHRLTDRLLEFERCPSELVGMLIVDVLLQKVFRGYGFVLATPSAAAHHPEVWRRLVRIETSPVNTALYWRAEARTMKQGAAAKLSADVQALLWLQMKRRIWLAERLKSPLQKSAKGPSTPYPEVSFAKDLSTRALGWLRYPERDLLTLQSLAEPPRSKYTLKLHHTRCQLAVTRSRWSRECERRKTCAPGPLPAPRDVFSGKTISGEEPSKALCDTTKILGDEVLSEPLPSYPITAANSGPLPARR